MSRAEGQHQGHRQESISLSIRRRRDPHRRSVVVPVQPETRISFFNGGNLDFFESEFESHPRSNAGTGVPFDAENLSLSDVAEAASIDVTSDDGKLVQMDMDMNLEGGVEEKDIFTNEREKYTM